MPKIGHYFLFFSLLFCILPTAEASLVQDLTSRIRAYTLVELSKEKGEVKAPICSAKNIISQMEKELDSMSVTMEKWDEIADQHISAKIERFKESLVRTCCPSKDVRRSRGEGSQEEHGRGRGRRRQQTTQPGQ